MRNDPVGITYGGVIGVYQDPDGLEVFETDDPYMLSDGKSLVAPIPVFYAGAPTYTDSAGNLQQSWAVSSILSWVLASGAWDDSGVWLTGAPW